MPNWCINRLDITGDATKLNSLAQWVTGECPPPAYRRAIAQSVRLLAAGVAGLRCPVGPMQDTPPQTWRFPPLPVLTGHGEGDDTPENRAFTRWLRLLMCNPPLDAHYCAVINRYWQQSGLAAVAWSDMTAPQQETVSALFRRQSADWFGFVSGRPAMTAAQRWQTPETESLPDRAIPVDMRGLIPTHLAAELNGFSGGLWERLPDDLPALTRERWRDFHPGINGYALYLSLYGVKWPRGHDVHHERHNDNRLTVDFDSPWGPPAEQVLMTLSRRYGVSLTHTFCDEGAGFCGLREYEHGELINQANDDLAYGPAAENGDETLRDITGPAYVIRNLRHYGGGD